MRIWLANLVGADPDGDLLRPRGGRVRRTGSSCRNPWRDAWRSSPCTCRRTSGASSGPERLFRPIASWVGAGPVPNADRANALTIDHPRRLAIMCGWCWVVGPRVDAPRRGRSSTRRTALQYAAIVESMSRVGDHRVLADVSRRRGRTPAAVRGRPRRTTHQAVPNRRRDAEARADVGHRFGVLLHRDPRPDIRDRRAAEPCVTSPARACSRSPSERP